MKAEGKIKSKYCAFEKDGDLAELMGAALGDGHIHVFPRTEELRITFHADDIDLVERYKNIIARVFGKTPKIIPGSNGVRSMKISIYEKHISKRLGVPTGNRRYLDIKVPKWILRNKVFIKRYLRGLYEAEGSFCVHPPTSTYKLIFTNFNDSMLTNVKILLEKLGFHPHRSSVMIQLSRKEEVFKAIQVLEFRKYELKGYPSIWW